MHVAASMEVQKVDFIYFLSVQIFPHRELSTQTLSLVSNIAPCRLKPVRKFCSLIDEGQRLESIRTQSVVMDSRKRDWRFYFRGDKLNIHWLTKGHDMGYWVFNKMKAQAHHRLDTGHMMITWHQTPVTHRVWCKWWRHHTRDTPCRRHLMMSHQGGDTEYWHETDRLERLD